jgi:hypothetical protein
VAAQMGQGLGGGALLLGQMPRGAQVGQSVIYLSLIIGLFILPNRLPRVWFLANAREGTRAAFVQHEERRPRK